MISEHFHRLRCQFSTHPHPLQGPLGLRSYLKLGGQDLHPKQMPCSLEADTVVLLSTGAPLDKRCV